MATVVTLADQGRTQAMVEAEREWARGITPGDRLTIDALWNRTERLPSRQISTPAVVAMARPTQGASQTGIMVTVASRTGAPVTIDAGWFLETQRAGRDAR